MPGHYSEGRMLEVKHRTCLFWKQPRWLGWGGLNAFGGQLWLLNLFLSVQETLD